jgi:hypothetical protein
MSTLKSLSSLFKGPVDRLPDRTPSLDSHLAFSILGVFAGGVPATAEQG